MTDAASQAASAIGARDPKGPEVKLGSGGMIQPFWGEFLVSPSPLEWSLNYCSHACVYCFANLNSPTRKGDASKALRQVADIGKRATLTDLFLRNHYPVCVANKSDPFSESNYRETVPVLCALRDAGVPLQFQTKGGFGIDDILENLQSSVWYITICQSDDAIRRRIEPNAPSIPERLALVDKLVDLGHHVVIGVNPAVPEWLPNPGELMEMLVEHHVWGVWIERLHLSKKQLMFMTPGVRKAIVPSAIERALQNKELPPVDEAFLLECRQEAETRNLAVYTFSYPAPTTFFDPWRDVYAHTLPTNQDFANTCWAMDLDETRLISFDDYFSALEAAASPYFPGRQRIGDYMRVVSYRTIENIANWTDWMTFKQLLWFAWCNPGNKLSLASHANFAAAITTNKKSGEDSLLTDEKGTPYYLFMKRGIGGYYFEYTGKLYEGP